MGPSLLQIADDRECFLSLPSEAQRPAEIPQCKHVTGCEVRGLPERRDRFVVPAQTSQRPTECPVEAVVGTFQLNSGSCLFDRRVKSPSQGQHEREDMTVEDREGVQLNGASGFRSRSFRSPRHAEQSCVEATRQRVTRAQVQRTTDTLAPRRRRRAPGGRLPPSPTRVNFEDEPQSKKVGELLWRTRLGDRLVDCEPVGRTAYNGSAACGDGRGPARATARDAVARLTAPRAGRCRPGRGWSATSADRSLTVSWRRVPESVGEAAGRKDPHLAGTGAT